MTPWAQDAMWLKFASSGMAHDPLTWVVIVATILAAVIKLASHAYQKIWLARRQTVIEEETRDAAHERLEETRDAEHERSQENIILEQFKHERNQALDRADQTINREIERLEKTIARLESQLEEKQQTELRAQIYQLRAEHYQRECKRLRKSLGLAEESSEPKVFPPPPSPDKES